MNILNEYPAEEFKFLALDHDIKTLRNVTAQISDKRFYYGLANAFQIMKGKYHIASPRAMLRRYCNPRKDFKGFRKILCPILYKMGVLKKEKYDLVYAAGLYDYIKTFLNDETKGTIALTRHLFDMVKPGGSLIIGNFNHSNPKDVRFVMDYICDWELIYRDKQEMYDFARTIPETQIGGMEILEEPLGINYFLEIKKYFG